MDKRCPFCWSQGIRKIADIAVNGTGQTRVLVECPDCERWYLEDSGEEVHELAELCLTLKSDPGKCTEVILQPIKAGYFQSPRTKIKEFNHICSECPHKRFML